MIPVNDVEACTTPSRALRTLLDLIAETRSLPKKNGRASGRPGIEPARRVSVYSQPDGFHLVPQLRAERPGRESCDPADPIPQEPGSRFAARPGVVPRDQQDGTEPPFANAYWDNHEPASTSASCPASRWSHFDKYDTHLGSRGRRLPAGRVRRPLARGLAARRRHAPGHGQALPAGGLGVEIGRLLVEFPAGIGGAGGPR
jgi:hypothetical protein